MRRSIIVLVSLVGVILATSPPAIAYVDVGYDARDGGQGVYDIRSTSRIVEFGEQRRYLKVIVKIYDADFDTGSYISIDARLDANRGRPADAVVHMYIADMSGSGCDLRTAYGRRLERGKFRINRNHKAVSCRVPTYRLRPTKTIRWKVTVSYLGGSPVYDVAPDVGMYG